MTPEEIKKIAEEYAEYINSAYLSDRAEKEALRVVQWLSERYFIVEKQMIKDYYAIHKEVWDKSINRDCLDYQKGTMVAMEYIFGSEIGKEEE